MWSTENKYKNLFCNKPIQILIFLMFFVLFPGNQSVPNSLREREMKSDRALPLSIPAASNARSAT